MGDVSLAYYLVHWVSSALAVLATSKIIPGFKVSGFTSAMGAAVLIGLVNMFIWPVLIFFTLPLNILTLGLFTFVINGAVLKIAAALFPGFEIDGWFAAIMGSVVLSIVTTILHYILF